MSFQNSYPLRAPYFLTFVAILNPYSFLNSKFLFKMLVFYFLYLILYKYSYMIIYMAMVEVQIYYPRHTIIIRIKAGLIYT